MLNFVVKIDPLIPLSDASFLSCGFSTGYGAAWKEAQVENGSSVAVFGLGAVGLGGAGKIIQIGAGAGEKSNVDINILGIIMGRTLKGTILGGLKAKSDLPIIYEKCKNREIQLDELLTHEIKLEDAYKASSELLNQPDCVKVFIKI
ncbi:hypothetical protein V6N13_148424 [Hibiscus sabdariffa]|uniref:Alcohol dehydrogenase n=1 Tax=Hibiscus sabdariffa TaxID=183260 RepID=A0ABR2TZ52_9ROSI